MKLELSVLLALFAGTAYASTSMVLVRQENAPVQLQSTTHGLSDALEGAVLKNKGQQKITSYRIGWVNVVGGRARFYRGKQMNTPGGIAAGAEQAVPAQAIPLDPAATTMTFFVSDVTFADGTRWHAKKAELRNAH